MAKIGTAQIEIKPVLNEEVLTQLCDKISESVAEAVRRGAETGAITAAAEHRLMRAKGQRQQ